MDDLQRWYDVAKQPKIPGGRERIDRAVKIMKLLRQMLSYGAAAELAHCERLSNILARMRSKGPARRRIKLELQHVEAFIPKAVEMGRLSLALGTAIQFETELRQLHRAREQGENTDYRERFGEGTRDQ